MGGFTRRFSSMPDAATIAAIEGVIIVDDAPDGPVASADSGTACFVGEYEDGPFATDPATPADSFHASGGIIDVTRDQWSGIVGTLGFTVNGVRSQYPCARRGAGELWNGNAYVQAKGLAFRRFLACRVDTSVGSVTFQPLAFQETGAAGPWVVANNQTLVFAFDGAANATATFTCTAATVTGSGAALSTVLPGDYVDLALDGGQTVRTTFQSGDMTISTVVARINSAFGATIASNASSQIALTSGTLGTASKVQVIAGGVLAKLGLTAATTSGTGNVANASDVQFAELQTIVQAITGSPIVRQTSKGTARVCSKTGSTGTVKVDISSTATGFGFTLGVVDSATSNGFASTIPAGTLINAGGVAATRVVTMQTLSIPANTAAAVSAKVRPALDDGSYLTQSANTLTTLETTISPAAEWIVTNPSSLSAALTDAQKDAAYVTALAVTKAATGTSRKINYIASARQSAVIRAALLANATATSGRGCYGRKARIAPPLGLTLTQMISATDPGVGAYRNERACYSPGWRKYIKEIADVGASVGGLGFSDSGIVETHGDIVLASLDSLLPPEENAAQTIDDGTLSAALYVGVESALAAWGVDEYTLAKSNGICAPRYHEVEGPQYESGVNTLDPAAYPGKSAAARVKLADFLTDSVSEFEGPYVKKNKTPTRVAGLLTKLTQFLDSLLQIERIAGFVANEGPAMPKALVLDWRVEPLDSMDSIVNRTAIGQGAITTNSL